MKILSVFNDEFKPFGNVIKGFDFSVAIKACEENSQKPEDSVIYVPSCKEIEDVKECFDYLKNSVYGGMPIQIGYCNGSNTKLNCLEYHKDSEINIACDDMILLLAPQSKVEDGYIDVSEVKAFKVPKGTAVEVYQTSLHYAPCNAKAGEGFRVLIVLPKGTNYDKPNMTAANKEDELLWASNKWLIAHPETSEAAAGAFAGIKGENIDIADLI